MRLKCYEPNYEGCIVHPQQVSCIEYNNFNLLPTWAIIFVTFAVCVFCDSIFRSSIHSRILSFIFLATISLFRDFSGKKHNFISTT